ncbi:MAG: helix-turn-helix transcriptional regulator [Phycisphaerales bacterium]|nr:helix-turn-helix transcriptional regulator [Phycisphaerales bacterium]
MSAASLHERLTSVASGKTYRSIADLTATHPETVRRYLQGQSPSVEFLAALCRTLGINADWLLTGRGPMRVEEVRAHALREANPTELHAAMASTISVLVDRVDRLETYCQTLETLLRGSRTSVPAAPSLHQTTGRPDADQSAAITSGNDERPDAAIIHTERNRRIADAVAKRPRPDAG